MATLNQLVTQINNAKFDGLPMGWAFPDNNCFTRARAVATFLHTGELPSNARLPQIVEALRTQPPKYAAAKIEFAGGVAMKGSFASTDSETAGRLTPGQRSVSWANHEATVVNTDDGLRVIDLALAKRPLKLEEWKALWMPESLQGQDAAPVVSDAEFKKARAYWDGAMGAEKPPKAHCLRFAPAFAPENELGNSKYEYILREDIHDMESSVAFVKNEGDNFSPFLDFSPGKIPSLYIKIESSKALEKRSGNTPFPWTPRGHS